MDKRINDWLDGRLALEQLSAAERERARELERLLELAARAEAGAAADAPDLTQRVMASLPPHPPERRRVGPGVASRLAELASRVRGAGSAPGALRPAVALAALCLAIGFGLGRWAAPDAGAPVVTTASAEPSIYVRFELLAPSAETVRLAGSFSEWQPTHELTPGGEGRWTITLPLQAGVHDYVFLVDGDRQVLDPAAPRIADGFGGFNNRIALLPSAL